MTAAQLVRTLQIVDSLFPVGAFAYSDGLESAAASGRVHDAKSLAGWLHHVLYGVFAPCEGLALLKCMRAMEKKDWAKVRELDEELTALRPASATRAAGKSIGKSLIATYASIADDGSFAALTAGLDYGNAAVAYAAVFHHRGIDCREALLAFGYARLATVVSAGLRLAAIGQQQGQAALVKVLDRLPDVTELILKNEADPLRSFSPLMDVQQMNHRYVYSRLFRS
jgi:urease accessory protein